MTSFMEFMCKGRGAQGCSNSSLISELHVPINSCPLTYKNPTGRSRPGEMQHPAREGSLHAYDTAPNMQPKSMFLLSVQTNCNVITADKVKHTLIKTETFKKDDTFENCNHHIR